MTSRHPALRFWDKVDTSGSCWEWQGATSNGYGMFWLNGQNVRANRYSWEFVHGPIPESLFVLHTCDNPPCVRPDHLYVGTHQQNVDDKYTRGRAARKQPRQKKGYATGERHGSQTHPDRVPSGENHPFARFTDAQVVEIRQRVANGEKQVALAAEFGVSKQTLNFVVSGKAFKYLPGAIHVYRRK